MDKEKDNSNIEEKVTISDLAEKAATMKQEEPKPKKRIGLGIMLTVLALLLVGGALATGYLWGNNTVKPIDSNGNENTAQSENGESKVSADTKIVNDEAEVKELMSQIYDALKDKPGSLLKTYDGTVYYQPEDMTNPTSLDSTYGVYYSYNDLSNTENLSSKIKTIFDDLGFSSYSIQTGFAEVPGYINNDKQIICETAWTASATAQISCGKTSWISDSKKTLINSLAKAKGGEFPILILADESDIMNSSVTPYQNLVAQVPNASGLFYRNSPDSEWKYFTSTQMIVPCEKYSEHPDAENVKKAFADQECLKDGSGTTLKVSEL